MKSLRKSQMKYQTVDEIFRDTQGLLITNADGKLGKDTLPSPILFELTDPLARFSCLPEMRNFVAKAAAESLYLLSGMNGSDFIWEFRGWEDPRDKKRCDNFAFGPPLRFLDQKDVLGTEILDYNSSNRIRTSSNTGCVDQLGQALVRLEGEEKEAIIQFASFKSLLSVHSAWFYIGEEKKLEMLISMGRTNNASMWYKMISPFTFLHQIISDLTEIPLGCSKFMIGELYTSILVHPQYLKSLNIPVVNMHDFKYPNSKLTLRDIDTLVSIMVEFVSRLDEKSLSRANPFDGDERVQLWSDYAEIFRAWKAEQLGYSVEMEQNFFHPQLRFIYKGESL